MKILAIELTNVCEHNCWFCPHSKMKREQGFISMETIEMATEKINSYGRGSVILNNIGESLLHSNFFEIVEMFEGVSTVVTVNAKSLTEDNVEKLIESSLDLLRISLDLDCNDLLIKKLLKERKNMTFLNVKAESREQVLRFREKWDEIEVRPFLNWAGQMDMNNDINTNICMHRDHRAGVLLWDGRICNCCLDYEGKYILGTLEEVEDLNFDLENGLCKTCGGICVS